MKVLVNTDINVDIDAEHAERVETDLISALERFERELTRIEVHLRDESAGRETVDDILCLLEARPTGLAPVVVTHHASTVAEALGGATDKLEARLTSSLGRRSDREHGRDTIRHP